MNSQVLTGPFKINGSFTWTSNGKVLSIDALNGLQIKDTSGHVLFSATMDGDVFGRFLENLTLTASNLSGEARGQHGIFLDTFENLVGWGYLALNGGQDHPPHGQAGGTVFRTTGEVEAYSLSPIPFDPSKTYRIRVRVKRTAGASTGKINVGILGFAADKITKVSLSGTDSFTSPHWVCCYNETPASGEWITFTGWIKGTTASPTQGPSVDPSAPKAIHQDIRYVSPIFNLNAGAGTDTYELDEISIDLVDDISDGVVSGSKIKAAAVDFTTHVSGSTKPEDNATVGADWETNLTNIPADLFHTLTGNLDDIPDGTTYKRVATASLDANHLVLLSAAVGTLDNITAGTTNKHFTSADESKLDGVEAGATVGANWASNLTGIPTDLFHKLVDTLDNITNGTTYGKILLTNISAGKILLAQCDNTGYSLDNVPEGSTYGRVLATDISSGHIKLSECVGNLDNIANGTTYGRVLLTDISAGHILLSACTGSLDDIDDGSTKVGYTPAEQAKLTGIASGATVGADWTTNLTGIPSTLTTPSANGLYLSTSYMGFYTGGAWTSYIDNAGNFYFKGDANSSIDWNITTPSTLTIKGKIIAGTGSSVDAAYISGAIIESQIANAAITTAKFASGIRPVEIVSSLPSAGTQGRTVFLTTDNKLYRDTGAAWTVAVLTSDLSGTIGESQIASDAVTANKIAAGAVTAGKIAAGAISATELAVGAVSETRIADGAVSTNKIYAGAVTAAKIAAGTITANEISVSTLSSLAADLGTVTAGTIALASSGLIRAGQTAYNTGTGFWLGFDGATPKFSLGNSSGSNVTWNGTALAVSGGTFTASSILTAASGARLEFTSSGLRGYDSFDMQRFVLSTSGAISLDSIGSIDHSQYISFATDQEIYLAPDRINSGFKIAHETGVGLAVEGRFGIGGASLADIIISGHDHIKGRVDGNIITDTTATGLDVTGNITVSGNVDGVDVSALGSTVSSHTGASSSVHGVTGSVMGTNMTNTAGSSFLLDLFTNSGKFKPKVQSNGTSPSLSDNECCIYANSTSGKIWFVWAAGGGSYYATQLALNPTW